VKNEQTLRTFNININNLLSYHGIKIYKRCENIHRSNYGYSIGFKKNINEILLENGLIKKPVVFV